MTYLRMTNVSNSNMMKNKNYKKSDGPVSKANEPVIGYTSSAAHKLIKDFTFEDFKKISSKIDFTQKEWSEILHISERTLQRYSKDNTSFSFSATDRILQIHKVITRGKEVFGSFEKFNLWLRENHSMPEGALSIYSLATFEGINQLLTQLGRIEHGILA